MIYQLAKTSPLLTGQVKMNLILNGNEVTDLQYTPISEYILFPRTRKPDTLNYTHGENVRMLYKRNSDSFFKPVQRPDLSYTALYKDNTLYRDTHDGTYEMSLRRLPYQRYGKQFEFFCPFWCDTREELENLEFSIVVESENKRKFCERRLNWNVIKKHVLAFFDTINLDTTKRNSEFISIDFNKHESCVKGLCVEDGNVHTFDTTYVLDKILECERTVLETDSTILSAFSTQKVISTQLFNFSFIFNIEDILPMNLLNSVNFDKLNMYVDMYENNSIIPCKDIYSNYEFIPKYDIETSSTNTAQNVLDYMKDYNCVDIINTNKLVQSSVHFSLCDNTKELFNVYSGFAPIHTKLINSTDSKYNGTQGLSNAIPDMYTEDFSEYRNAFGIVKYINLSNNDLSKVDKLLYAINYESSFTKFNFSELQSDKNSTFENIVINSNKVLKLNAKEFIIDKKIVNTLYANVILVNSKYSENGLKTLFDQTTKSKSWFIPLETIEQYERKYSSLNIRFMYHCTRSKNTFLLVRREDLQNGNGCNIYVSIVIKKDGTGNYDNFAKMVYYSSLRYFNYDSYLERVNFLKRSIDIRNRFVDYKGNTIPSSRKIQAICTKYENEYNKTPVEIPLRAFSLLCSILNCALLPSKVVFEKTLLQHHYDSPKYTTNEITYSKVDTNIELQRYCGKLIPMFVDLDSNYYNNVYWNKQYMSNTIEQELSDFVKLANTKFAPIYKSIDFYPLTSKKLDYEKFYLDNESIYALEKSWYKANSLFCLQSVINETLVKEVGQQITKNDICEILYNKMCKQIYDDNTQSQLKTIISAYICDLYTWSCTYDYISEKDINNLKYDIKITLK